MCFDWANICFSAVAGGKSHEELAISFKIAYPGHEPTQLAVKGCQVKWKAAFPTSIVCTCMQRVDFEPPKLQFSFSNCSIAICQLWLWTRVNIMKTLEIGLYESYIWGVFLNFCNEHHRFVYWFYDWRNSILRTFCRIDLYNSSFGTCINT